jgi:hypothetical protein
MSAQRIYIVSDNDTTGARLVKATSQAQAIRHVAESRYNVEVASAMDVADMMVSGITVENASAKPAESTEG